MTTTRDEKIEALCETVIKNSLYYQGDNFIECIWCGERLKVTGEVRRPFPHSEDCIVRMAMEIREEQR